MNIMAEENVMAEVMNLLEVEPACAWTRHSCSS